VYNVEKIVDKRIRDSNVEYLLKWEGYPDTVNSWEIASHLRCASLIEEFEKKNCKAKKKKC